MGLEGTAPFHSFAGRLWQILLVTYCPSNSLLVLSGLKPDFPSIFPISNPQRVGNLVLLSLLAPVAFLSLYLLVRFSQNAQALPSIPELLFPLLPYFSRTLARSLFNKLKFLPQINCTGVHTFTLPYGLSPQPSRY